MNIDTPRAVAPPIWFLALCTASAVIGLTLLSTTLPLIKAELNVSSESVQQLLTVYMVALALGQLVYGPVSDKVGRRPILLLGAILFSLAGIAAVFSQGINQLIALRGIQGFGAAACIAMGRAIVTDVFERNEAARQMSTISMILALAPAMSLAFGGVIAQTQVGKAQWPCSHSAVSLSLFLVFY